MKWCIYFGKKQWESSSNDETKLPYATAILLLIHSIEMKTCIYTNTLTQMVTATLIIIAQRWKQAN